MQPNHLYIIGNGFDLHHGAKSRFLDFKKYLLKVDPKIVRSFDLFFGPRSLVKSFAKPSDFMRCLEIDAPVSVPTNSWADKYLWSDFEKYVGGLNREKIFDVLDVLLPKIDEDDENFSYGEFYASIDEILGRINSCLYEMKYRFQKWINTIHYEKGFRDKMIQIDEDALFLNFNYTLFLEKEYGIKRDNILYIHGNRRDPYGSLILGHRLNYEEEFSKWIYKNKNRRRYRDNLKGKNGNYFANDKLSYLAYFLKDEEKGNWRLPIRYYAVDKSVGAVEEYYQKSCKNVEELIDKNRAFFNSLSKIQTITVLGHSLSSIDMPYFNAIASVIDKATVKWNFSYYGLKDKFHIKSFCRHLNIPLRRNARWFSMPKLSVNRAVAHSRT